MDIVDMRTLDNAQRLQAAHMLVDELPIGWPTLADATREVGERLQEEGAAFFAAVHDNAVIGWCGILPSYFGKVFELHPLVVRKDWQRKGVGTKLVNAVEQEAKQRGGLTLWLGADDERPGGETSFANVDLYDDLPRRLREFNPGTHQAGFYLKLGFHIMGVMPDANGPGKPDIYFAKKL